jgi:uncharacterized RDD family membrane protein YckC
MSASSEPADFELASIRQRFVAQAVDIVIALAFAELCTRLFQGASFQWPIVILAWLPGLLYRLLGDGLFGGAALGKRLMGIQVVDTASRAPCSLGQSAIRMSVVLFPLIYVVEVILLACDGRQRWGDRVAHTYVLRRHVQPPPLSKLRPVDLSGLGETLGKIKKPGEDA